MTTTTVIEKSGSLTIYKADVEYEIPPVDLLTLLFGRLHSIIPRWEFQLNKRVQKPIIVRQKKTQSSTSMPQTPPSP